MADENNIATNVHFFVGFGGSGGKTLANFAELISQDSKWAKKADESLYFLLCDTDEKELAEAKTRISDAFDHVACDPLVRRVGLADDVPSMSRVITKTFMEAKKSTDANARQRLEEHWWCKDDIPFTASFLPGSPSQGASQCPAVASFLAWHCADKLKGVVADIVNEMHTRIGHGGTGVGIGVTMVASLAGGTGRGSWPILGFLIRDALTKALPTAQVMPQAYLFDQGVFDHVQLEHPEQRVKQRVNSLTGLSELVMWVRNDAESVTKPILHSLPNLKRPGDEDHDVICVKREVEGMKEKGKSPISHAWVIFRESGNGWLKHSQDYYRMVAGCLYAQVATGRSSQEHNNIQAIGSAASAICRVNVNDIRHFLRSKVVAVICEDIATGGVGGVNDYQDWDVAAQGSFGHQPNDTGSILEKISYHIRHDSEFKVNKNELAAQMKKQNESGAIDIAKLIDGSAEPAGNKKMARRACMAALGQSELDPTADAVKAEIAKALISEVYAKDSSPAALAAAADGLRELVSTATGALKNLKAIRIPYEDFDSLEKVVEKCADRQIWKGETLNPLIKFSETEQEDTLNCVLAAACSSKATLETVKELLTGGFGEALAKLDTIKANSNRITTSLSHVVDGYNKSLADDEARLFIRRDPGNDDRWDLVDHQTPDPHDATRFVDRILRPPLDEEVLKKIADRVKKAGGTTAERKTDLETFIKGEIGKRAAGTPSDNANFERTIKGLVDKLAASINVSHGIMVEYFSVSKVLHGLHKAWQERVLDEPEGHTLDGLARSFKSQFGIPLIERMQAAGGQNRSGVDVPDEADMVAGLALSLARTCDPFLLMEDLAWREDGDRVQLSLPDEKKYFTDTTIRKMTDESLLRSYNLNKSFRPNCGANPFLMVAINQQSFVTEGEQLGRLEGNAVFENVQSMEYWKDDPKVKHWLELVECESGDAMFTGKDMAYGLGFADPRYVRPVSADEEGPYLSQRWRPWLKKTSAQEKESQRQLDAMLYTLLGHVGADANDDTVAVCERAKAVVEETFGDWSMPLVTRNKRSFECGRYPMHEGPTGISPNKKVWNAGDTIGSIGKFEAAFTTEGDAKAWTEAVLCERAIFLEKLERNLGNRYDALLHGLHHYLEDLWKEAKGTPGENAASFMATIERMQNRLEHQLQAVAK